MRIGFDAKRAFFNTSGLGNYSREVIRSLSHYYPDEQYILYAPSCKDKVKFDVSVNVKTSTPGKWHKAFKSYWRSFLMTQQLKDETIELYHGLSAELPKNIEKTNICSVVTIHDLIFIRYPSLYHPVDRRIYLQKTQYACNVAGAIVAISEQTKRDLIDFIKADEEKIHVVYQTCKPIFYNLVSDEIKQHIRKQYNLPEQYLLFVGTIEKRKNLLQIIKAVNEYNIDIPVVAVGKQRKYFKEIEQYIHENSMDHKVHFYHNINPEDLPAIYQMADVFVYPSVFEGFGIPIIEALYSKTPVITSKGSCFPEAGGPDSIYIDPENVEELAQAILKVLNDTELQTRMCENGHLYVQKFNDRIQAEQLMKIYRQCRKH